jgi:hypothetical protein
MNDKRNQMRALACLAMVLTLTASCATRQADPSGRKAALDCKVNPNVICYSAGLDRDVSICTPPTPAVSGVMICESTAYEGKVDPLSVDPSSLVQNGTATQMISAPVMMPNGEIAAVAACAIRRRHNSASVTYASVSRGPETKAQADYLRDSLGACLE